MTRLKVFQVVCRLPMKRLRGNKLWAVTSTQHTGAGVHPFSYPKCSRDSFSGGKAAGVRSWPLISSAEVKNAWS